MGHIATPEFREMDRAECEALLGRNNVGRLAFTFHDRVDIEPIHFVFADGVIYGRTGPGTKLETLAHHPWVAFEVDEVQDLFRWRSVVVHGTFYQVERGRGALSEEGYTHAVRVLQRLLPETFTSADPVPDRTVVFRIPADQITGRAAGTR